ncbi:hypothetical protein S1361_01335 [Streptomyces cyanogenus]|uniref:Uncharacterized protein n=1 Tax=Streptomyces cyanogenus TaxID=80860 RepID=A0ABX7THM5_STRCY|nr:hypothetical protein S1361_01335 [Streptomyces cyanogenus]
MTKTIARYGRGDLLCIDELLSQVLTEREETRTFTGPRLCAAIVDRLAHTKARQQAAAAS